MRRKWEKINILSHSYQRTPESIINQILFQYYCADNDSLVKISEAHVLLLHMCHKRGPVWHEAMATLMMAQHRFAEAYEAYRHLLETSGALPLRTSHAAARFGWPYDLQLPESSQCVQEDTICSAAAASNLEMVTRLHQAGAHLDNGWDDATLAELAAQAGSVHIIVISITIMYLRRIF